MITISPPIITLADGTIVSVVGPQQVPVVGDVVLVPGWRPTAVTYGVGYTRTEFADDHVSVYDMGGTVEFEFWYRRSVREAVRRANALASAIGPAARVVSKPRMTGIDAETVVRVTR